MAANSVNVAGRMGTFEVYGNLGEPQGKTAIVLMFSKKNSGMWPHFAAVGGRASRAIEEATNNGDLRELEEKYTTRIQPAERGISPGRSRNSRFRATSATNFSRFNQTGGSNVFAFAPDSAGGDQLRTNRDASAPPMGKEAAQPEPKEEEEKKEEPVAVPKEAAKVENEEVKEEEREEDPIEFTTARYFDDPEDADAELFEAKYES